MSLNINITSAQLRLQQNQQAAVNTQALFPIIDDLEAIKAAAGSPVAGVDSINALNAPAQTLAKADDTNVTLSIVSAISTHTFTMGWTGSLAATRGGTGLSAYATGDILYASAANTLSALTAGTNGDVLTLSGGIPSWAAPVAGGITSLNAQTGATQTFATGTAGTDFAISSALDVHTFDLPTASALNRGALSSADWTAFDSKFDLPALTAGSVIFSNGTTLAQDNANFFWDDTLNSLGIGTATPIGKLSVKGVDGAFGSVGFYVTDSGSNPTLDVRNNGHTGIASAARADYILGSKVNGYVLMDLQTNNDTTTSRAGYYMQDGTVAFDYFSASNTEVALASGGYMQNASRIANSIIVSGGMYHQISGSGDFIWGTGAGTFTETMRFTFGGSLGIGTASPTARLHVVGAWATSATYSLKIENSSASPLFNVRDDGHIGIGFAANTNYVTIVAGASVAYADEALGVYGGNGTTDLFHIKNNGHMGFGSDASSVWDFNSNRPDGVFWNLQSSNNSTTSRAGYYFNSGQGGIDYYHALNTETALVEGGFIQGAITTNISIGSSGGLWNIIAGAGDFKWGTGSALITTKMVLSNAGNLGIGLTSGTLPTSMLDINGATGYNQLRMRTTYTPTGSADANGNVGDLAWDDDFIYIRNSTQWERVATAAF